MVYWVRLQQPMYWAVWDISSVADGEICCVFSDIAIPLLCSGSIYPFFKMLSSCRLVAGNKAFHSLALISHYDTALCLRHCTASNSRDLLSASQCCTGTRANPSIDNACLNSYGWFINLPCANREQQTALIITVLHSFLYPSVLFPLLKILAGHNGVHIVNRQGIK